MSKKFVKNGKQNQSCSKLVLYGRHAVMAALENPARKIQKLVCFAENATSVRAKYPHVNIVVADKKEIDKLVGVDSVHQGYALYCSELEGLSIEELCHITADKQKCNVLILDQVTDPQNIGAIIRSCAAFGTTAVIVQDKNSPQESGSMAKAAAGTMEIVPVVRVTNLARAIETLKKNGFWIVGMDGYAKENVDKLDKNAKLAVIMGSEGSGMRRLIEESCDITVRLPIDPRVESLNVSTAAAVVLYELSR